MRLLFVSYLIFYREQRLSKIQDAGLMKEKDAQSFIRRIERLLFLSTGPNDENFVADTEQALNRRLKHLLRTVMSRRILREQESGVNSLREFSVCLERTRSKRFLPSVERSSVSSSSEPKLGLGAATRMASALSRVETPIPISRYVARCPNLFATSSFIHDCQISGISRQTVFTALQCKSGTNFTLKRFRSSRCIVNA
jgi:hypothetical protein